MVAFDHGAFDPVAFEAEPGDVVPDYIDQTAVIFDMVLSTVGEQFFSAPLIDQTAVAHAPQKVRIHYAGYIVADAPVAYWQLGEPSGVFVDTMVGNDGTAGGTVTRPTQGIVLENDAISVAGAGRVSIPDSADMDFTTPFSIEMWVKQSSANALDNALWGKGSGGVPYLFVTGSSQAPAGRVTLAKSDTADVVQSSAIITDTDWHHIVVTYSHNVEAKVYVDGNDLGGTPTYHGFNANSTAAGIGSKTGASNDSGWNGQIDEVAIYNYVLSPAQVIAHYQQAPVARTVTVARISQTATSFAPTLVYNQSVSLGLIDRTAVAHAASLDNVDIFPDFIDQTAVAFAPTFHKPVSYIGSVESIRTSTINPASFTGNSTPGTTGSGNNYQTGFVVSIVMNGSGGNMVTGVTFGGVAMTEIVAIEDPAGEPGFASLWFCVPDTRGAQTVTYTLTSATDNDFQVVAWSFASEHTLEVIDFDSVAGDIDDPSVVLSPGGRESLAVGVMFSGLDAPASISELGTMFIVQDHDFGTTSSKGGRQRNVGTTDFTFGFTTTAADDVALVALLLAETTTKPIQVGRITQTAVIHAPDVSLRQLDVGLINQTAAIHAPSISISVSLGLIDRTAVAYSPSVSEFPGQDIVLGLISSSASAFAPSVESRQDIFFDRINRQALPFNPSVSGGVTIPPITMPATVVIRYDGANITDDVMLASASFTTQVNGTPGTCSFRIKDPTQTYSIVTGKRLTLDINGEHAWTGYVSKVSRVYAFAAQDTSNPSLVTRLLQVDGVDINILFKKRIVFQKSNPKSLEGRKYTVDNTDDVIAFRDLVEDFLDLGGDNLDTTTLIESVGTINVDHPSNPIAPGHDWGSSMRSITALSNGVYYIDPDRKVVLTDVDTPNAPFDLSDDPADSAVGYRDMEIIYNASNMINDMIVWGAGKGSSEMVYSRESDSTSISTHGRWQAGEFRGDMYKQGTVNRRADSIVQGSAQSKRGAKDDAIQVVCTVFEPGLRASQKVDFTSAAFGYQDVLPIRRMTITFISPTQPRYQIIAGHEIDMPWGHFDIVRYDTDFDVGGTKVKIPELPGIDIDEICLFDCECPDDCGDETCGITDTFTRTITGGFGTSDSGISWTTATSGTGGTTSFDVAGGLGYIYNTGSSGGMSATATLGGAIPNEHLAPWDPTAVKTMRFKISNVAPIYRDFNFMITFGPMRGPGTSPRIVWSGDLGAPFGGASGEWHIMTTGGLRDGTLIPDSFWNDTTVYTWTVTDDGDGTYTTAVTDGTDTYSIGGSTTGITHARCSIVVTQDTQSGPGAGPDRSLIILDIDIPEINSCNQYRFDNFDRTVASGWGTASVGSPSIWSVVSTATGITTSVDGSSGRIVMPTTATLMTQIMTVGTDGPWASGDFTMNTRVLMPDVSTGIAFYIWSASENKYFYVSFRTNTHPNTMTISDSPLTSSDSETIDLIGGGTSDWIRIKWEHIEGTSSQAKVWLDTDTEPEDWLVTRSATGSALVLAGDPELRVSVSKSTSGVQTTYIDYIDFDYEGKPCNGSSGTLEVLDDFDRSIAVGNALDKWGDTSGTGDPWTNVVDGSSQGHLEYGVDNGEAIAQFVMTFASTQTKTMMMTLNEGGSDLFPFNTVGAGVPDQLFESDDIWWAIDFLTTTVDPLRLPYIEFDWADRVDRDVDGALIGMGLYNLVSPVRPYIGVSGFNFNGVPDQLPLGNDYFLANTWYTVEATRQGNYIFARVYQADSAPPGWQISLEIDPTLWEAGEFTIWGTMRQISGTPTTEEFRFRNFRLLGGCDQDPVVTVPSSGRVCQDFTGDGSKTDFYTQQSQKYGMTSVTVDGLYKTTHEYVQIEVDGNLVGVSLLNPPANGAIVHVCYTVGEGIGPFSLGPV